MGLWQKSFTHFGVAQVIFFGISNAGHVILSTSNFLSLDRNETFSKETIRHTSIFKEHSNERNSKNVVCKNLKLL